MCQPAKTVLHRAFLLLLLPTVVSAEWILMDDFESYAPGVLDPSPYPVARNSVLGKVDIVTDVSGIGGNHAAWFWGGLTNHGGDAWHQMALPEVIPIDGKGTIFFRMWQAPQLGATSILSFSKTAAGDFLDGSPIWSYFSGLVRWSWDDLYDARDGDHYAALNSAPHPTGETWYRYWIVIDNSYDAAQEQPAGVGGYEVYRQGPDDPAPILLAWGESEAKAVLAMRNQDYAPIRSFILSQNYHLGSGPEWLIDDIYFANSACVTDPTTGADCESWCDYAVVDGWSHVGDDFGWLFVDVAPWVYSLKLDTWLYLTGCPGEGGFWTFVVK